MNGNTGGRGARAYPPHRERELIGRVRAGDRGGARRILNEWLMLIFYDTAGRLDVIKARVLELVAALARAAVESGAELRLLFGEGYARLAELDGHTAFEDVCAWIVRTLDAFLDAVYAARDIGVSRNLSGAIDFIRENYARDIKLQDAAAAVPVNPYYLSHLFREELGMTFVEYLARTRVEQAKQLLTGTKLRVQDIAARVGYDDAGYFARVFHRKVGVTPGVYRRR